MNNNGIGYTTDLGNAFMQSLENVMTNFLGFLPNLLGALIILIIGLIIASIVSSVVRRVIRFTGIDSVIDKVEAHTSMKRMGLHFSLSGTLAWIVKWLIIVATLITMADTLGLHQINTFLNQVLLYIPNIFVAIGILAIGFIAGDFIRRIVVGALSTSMLKKDNVELLGNIAKYGIIIFSVMAALIQLNIATSLIQMLFGGIILALALAFGLGGREHASRWLDRISSR